MPPETPSPAGIATRDREVLPGVDARAFLPATPGAPVLLVIADGDLTADAEARCRALAAGGGLLVVHAGYRPGEAPLTRVDDCDRVLQWVRSVADTELDADGSRIALLGLGEGVGIAAELERRIAARGEHEIEFRLEAGPDDAVLAAEARARLDEVLAHRARTGAPTPAKPAIDVVARVEPEFLPFLDRLARWDSTSIDTIRATYLQVKPPAAPPTPGVERRDATIPGPDGRPDVPVRWYHPTGLEGPLPALLYCHGGAYIMGSLDENDVRLDAMALELGCRVVSVDYRLAPEHPYPAGLEDVETVWRHLLAESDDLGLDPSRLVIGGASAGAGLVTAACLRLKELGVELPRFQLLIYPMLDDTEATNGIAAIENGPGHWGLWHIPNERQAWAAYHRDLPPGEVPATAAPLRATVEELRGLPPAFIGVGDVDAYVDANIEYARRLQHAGVPVELHVYPGVIHGGFLAKPFTPRTRQFLRDANEALRLALAPAEA